MTYDEYRLKCDKIEIDANLEKKLINMKRSKALADLRREYAKGDKNERQT